MDKKLRVLFLCKRRLDDYGNSSGLFNSANFVVSYLNSKGIEAKAMMLQDSNRIDKEVKDYDPTHVIIEAIWVTSGKMRELMSLKRHHNRQWIIRIHSKLPFLANEGIAFSWMNEYSELCETFSNFAVAPNNDEVTHDLRKVLGLRTVYLPNIYVLVDYCDKVPEKKDEQFIDIGCFGAIRPMKNHLIQAVAAIKFANKIGKTLRFHINGGRYEQRGEQVHKNLKALFDREEHILIEHQWAAHSKFMCFMKDVDIGLQVSLSETFNIVAADLVSNNIPVVGSHEIGWLSRFFKADPNSSSDIAAALLFTYKVKRFNLHYLNNFYLFCYNFAAKRRWLKFLEM